MLRHDTYRIERVLGQGGFGITYLATDLNLDRPVAIKEFFPQDYCDRELTTSHVSLGTQSSADFVNRLKVKFLKEARNIAKFDNQGIIKIHAAFEENNTAYYVMDYIEGESLSDMVKKNGPLSQEKALKYISQVGKALTYVHDQKINHLDIKPANIMVRRKDDNPILIDFGLSKQYDSSGNQTSTTPTGISHGYAPMEQYTDGGVKEFSPQTDLYSLAATLYYILSGVVPPQATQLIEEDLTFPETIPPRLAAIITRAMAPKRKDRHESVMEFVEQVCQNSGHDTVVKPAPAVIVTPPVNPDNSPEDVTVMIDSQTRSKGKMTRVIGASVAVIAIVIVALYFGGKDSAPTLEDVVESTEIKGNTQTVKNMFWQSPLGTASYTGEVIVDPTTDQMIPHGKGRAEITDSRFKGSVYEGHFVNGVMEGEATYIPPNGDVFSGTYKNNEYSTGKYTSKASGDYFIGSFKDGQPYKGDWYSKDGTKYPEHR